MGSAIMADPRISRGRDSGSGSVRMSTTATTPRTTGASTTGPPISVRSAVSIHCPTGPAA